MSARYTKIFHFTHTFAQISLVDMKTCLTSTRGPVMDDPNLKITPDLNAQLKAGIKGFFVTYTVPDFIRAIFKMQHLQMYEHLDFSEKDKIYSSLGRTGPDSENMNLLTETSYTQVGDDIVTNTKVSVVLPFLIPPFLVPAVTHFAKQKTIEIRMREQRYLDRVR